ncbi:MAG: LLM class flavin-dependent oxidoreductase [Gammaproteobacteria bacterium]|nr:LLM class flavin-dependent oxidoreductase [Gammaproteobacteria bacterium]
METGVCVASHINDVDYVVRAEELGYSHAWLADSQMLWSDCYAALALAATRTSRINLGTGVAITGTRPAPNNASGIATVNALAPGRTFFGVGSGNTAMRVMGLPPQRIAEFDRYLATVAPLLRGEEAIYHHGDKALPIRHVMPDDGFVNFKEPIPMYVSGFGPKSLGLAGKHGDGAVLALPANPAVMANIWRMIETGAAEAGRAIDRDAYYTTALTTMVVLDPGEAVDSPRVKSECGAMAMAAVHFAYDQFRNFGRRPSGYLLGIWDDYRAMIESYPAERRHQRIHGGHNCWVLPEEERFLTPEILRSTAMIGERDVLIERLSVLADAGLDQIMILPNFDTRFDVLERVAKDIIPNV